MIQQKDTGLVFDIQRTSIYDGPGIRTTIFLKGCPLSCLWCHNPESQQGKPELGYFAEKCTHCRKCEQVCSEAVHSFSDTEHFINWEKCNTCRRCVESCPASALIMYGEKREADEVISIVEKDLPYYQSSGGGMTITGGEPLAQPGFSLSLLKKAQERGIHTCLETSGHSPAGNLKELAQATDLFLFDYKATGTPDNPHIHRQLTGVSQELILENLNRLLEKKHPLILRCPLVPGVNDSDEHLEEIGRLGKEHPHIGVEIMAYHSLGENKAIRIGKEPGIKGLKDASDEQKNEWLKKIKAAGCSQVKTG